MAGVRVRPGAAPMLACAGAETAGMSKVVAASRVASAGVSCGIDLFIWDSVEASASNVELWLPW